MRGQQLIREEQIAKGVGVVLLLPQPLMFGEQPVVVTLSLGSRKEMANVSSVRLTYELPQKGTRHTVPMVPIVNYLDGFGAKVPFTETGAWRLDIQVFRTGGVPAVATFRVSCCGDRQLLLSGVNYILKSSPGIPIQHESEDQ